jgi:Sec-independent protein secretion pathway component TatC
MFFFLNYLSFRHFLIVGVFFVGFTASDDDPFSIFILCFMRMFLYFSTLDLCFIVRHIQLKSRK